MTTLALANLLKLLATRRRLEILKILFESPEPVNSSIIGARLGIDDGPASANLTLMAEHGIVLRHQSGKYVFYTANRQLLNEIFSFFAQGDTECNTPSVP